MTKAQQHYILGLLRGASFQLALTIFTIIGATIFYFHQSHSNLVVPSRFAWAKWPERNELLYACLSGCFSRHFDRFRQRFFAYVFLDIRPSDVVIHTDVLLKDGQHYAILRSVWDNNKLSKMDLTKSAKRESAYKVNNN